MMSLVGPGIDKRLDDFLFDLGARRGRSRSRGIPPSCEAGRYDGSPRDANARRGEDGSDRS